MRLSPMKRKAIRQMVLLDYIAAALAWFTLWMYRQHVLTRLSYFDTLGRFHSRDYINTLFVIPAGWFFAYLMSGTYFDLYRKSRLNEVNRTLISCIIGCIMVSVIVFANDSSGSGLFAGRIGLRLVI